MGVIIFGSLAVWVPNPDWLYRILVLCDGFQPPRLGRGVRAVSRLCIEYPGICLTAEENHGKLQSG